MKNIEVYNLLKKLTAEKTVKTGEGETKTVSIFAGIQHTEFQWLLQKNMDKLEREVKLMQKAVTALKPELLKSLQEEINELVKCAIADAAKDNKELTIAEIQAIDRKTVDAWEKRDEWQSETKQFDDKMSEFDELENDLQIHQISFELIRPLNLDYEQMAAIKALVAE